MSIDFYTFLVVVWVLILVLVFMIVSQCVERRFFRGQITELSNRFMARSFQEYAAGRMSMEQLRDALEEVDAVYDDEEDEKAMADRLPVN